MTLNKGVKANLSTLIDAANAGRLAVLECQMKDTGKIVPVIVALNEESNGDTGFVPFAVMFEGNPYELLNPPNPDGGFYQE
jgi:Family of unknown function (DUF6117)